MAVVFVDVVFSLVVVVDFDHGTDGGGGFVVFVVLTTMTKYMTTSSMMIKIPSLPFFDFWSRAIIFQECMSIQLHYVLR